MSTSGTGAEYQTANYFHSEQIEVYGTAIWGSYGKFAVVHEYGHALHNASLGGIPSVSGCSSHYVDGATNLSCAFVEGFADYHATALGASYFNFTTFDYSRECTSRDANGTCLAYSSTTGNGAKVEGGVASFLLHMTNGGPFQYPGNYVATLVRTCYGNFAHVDGVDYFTYCAEQRIDPSVASYFWERSQPANVTFQAGTPANWSASDIRARWLWDLFRVSP